MFLSFRSSAAKPFRVLSIESDFLDKIWPLLSLKIWAKDIPN